MTMITRMRSVILIFTLCCVPHSTTARPFQAKAKTAVINGKAKTSVITPALGSSRFERYISKIFDDADTNKNGSISLSETYELVLKLYININRQAPIPAPTRRKVYQLFLEKDIDNNSQITRAEFTSLATDLGRRAFLRLVAHKVVTLVGAPLLATYVFHRLHDMEWLSPLAEKYLPAKIVPTVTNPNFGKTLLMVVFVSTLGNIVMGTVNWLLDMTLPDVEKDTRLDNERMVL